ncbi:MAG TPA: ATP-binding cassette domain-containing protein [bacterium]|jgi:ABC-type Mn2+/Zn2+ transport system ATPase subunit|nr:ATP-binding cassette domain-containing protein [bacterium]
MKRKISFENVSVGYMSETVIKDLSLDIAEGDIVGIFGPNGAGKTTLLCAVNGLARVLSGNVYIEGRKVNKLNGNVLRKNIGYVPQHFEIDSKLPVISEEVILMGSYGRLGLLRYPNNREKLLLDEFVGMLDMSNIIKKPFGQLSGGEKKRVLIARALMQAPSVMLFDEIFAWLDRDMVKSFTDVIIKLHKSNNLTTLIVSHDMHIIRKICPRVIWMEKGKIIMDAGRDEFLKKIRESDGII